MDIWSIQIPVPLALAVVATVGYLFGRRATRDSAESSTQSDSELRRARDIAGELEKIALNVRKSLARHHASVIRFKQRLDNLSRQQQEVDWKDLCHEADEILNPTLRLATQLANAYDEIRQQSSNLMTFTEASSNLLTGEDSPRGPNDAIGAQIATMVHCRSHFSLAIFDIDHFTKFNDEQGRKHGNRVLKELAALLDQSVRENDVISRHDGEKFVVVMPQTDLHSGSVFSDRLRAKVEEQLTVTVSGGVAEAIDGDTQETLLRRAEAALFSAKSAGHNCVFSHDGQETEPVVDELLSSV